MKSTCSLDNEIQIPDLLNPEMYKIISLHLQQTGRNDKIWKCLKQYKILKVHMDINF